MTSPVFLTQRAFFCCAQAKPITVHFAANTSDTMPWSFKPQQKSVVVVPGEVGVMRSGAFCLRVSPKVHPHTRPQFLAQTALAFYTAYNPSDAAVTGVSTYNVNPPKAGLYFHKVRRMLPDHSTRCVTITQPHFFIVTSTSQIQCFCFEEQRLRPHEEIDMPVRVLVFEGGRE